MVVRKPPMGWNSWNTFGENISETLIMETADAMVERGLKDAGYEYVVIDDCWSLRERDENGKIVADPAKFPHGMKYLSDYVHSKGLKFGMYSCCGGKTCAGYPGSFDHEFVDAKTFAEYGADLLKYDNCWKPQHTEGPLLYYRMGLALKACGRDILFSACNWGNDDVWSWARSAGIDMYRSTGDIYDTPESFKNIAVSQIPRLASSAPGCYNDPDMLICGMYNNGNVSGGGGCKKSEYEMHFALWCMMNAPLMIGCDIRSCDEETLALLKNEAYLAIDRDSEARPPLSLSNIETDGMISLFKHLENNEFCFGVFNFNDHDMTKGLYLFDLGFTQGCGVGLEFEDLATGEKIIVKESHNFPAPAHSCKMYRCRFAK